MKKTIKKLVMLTILGVSVLSSNSLLCYLLVNMVIIHKKMELLTNGC